MKIHTARRTHGFTESVIRMMTRLSNEHGAINLSQGFPDFESPDTLKIGAARAIYDDVNQYAITWGAKRYRDALAASYRDWYGLDVDPEAHLTITCGATEAMMAVLLAVVDPGEEVIVFEPFYENYGPDTTLCDATPVFVPLTAEWQIDFDRLRAAFSDRTRAIIVNTPNNPTGRVFSRDEIEKIAIRCQEFDAYAITDEVYEHIRFDEKPHLSLASHPGMWERTVTMSSVGKSFSLTGWKTGWAVASEDLTAGVRAAHQFLTFTTPNPMQHGTAVALAAPQEYFEELRALYTSRRDLLAEGLDRLGFGVYTPEGTYFLLADHRPFGFSDDVAFVNHVIEHVGVAAIPPSVFYNDPADGAELVGFAFCKSEDTRRSARRRLEGIRR